jgi:predicted cupin superfamily sugar epimerase
VRSDELWLRHGPGPLRTRLGGDGGTPGEAEAVVTVTGGRVERGEQPRFLVPAGHWQSAEPVGAQPVLLGCVVAPGFDYQDYENLHP